MPGSPQVPLLDFNPTASGQEPQETISPPERFRRRLLFTPMLNDISNYRRSNTDNVSQSAPDGSTIIQEANLEEPPVDASYFYQSNRDNNSSDTRNTSLQDLQVMIGELTSAYQTAIIDQYITDMSRNEMVEELSRLLRTHVVAQGIQSNEQMLNTHLQSQIQRDPAVFPGVPLQLSSPRVQRNDFTALGIDNEGYVQTFQPRRHLLFSSREQNPMRSNLSMERIFIRLEKIEKSLFDMSFGFEKIHKQQEFLERCVQQLFGLSFINNSKKSMDIQPHHAGECAVCLQENKIINCVLYRCGHMATCYECGLKLKGKPCPICRAEIVDVLKAYSCRINNESDISNCKAGKASNNQSHESPTSSSGIIQSVLKSFKLN